MSGGVRTKLCSRGAVQKKRTVSTPAKLPCAAVPLCAPPERPLSSPPPPQPGIPPNGHSGCSGSELVLQAYKCKGQLPARARVPQLPELKTKLAQQHAMTGQHHTALLALSQLAKAKPMKNTVPGVKVTGSLGTPACRMCAPQCVQVLMIWYLPNVHVSS